MEGFFSREKLSITAFMDKYVNGYIKHYREQFDKRKEIIKKKFANQKGYLKLNIMDNELHFLEYKMDVLRHAHGKTSECIDRKECADMIGHMGSNTYLQHKALKEKFEVLRKKID